MRIPGGGNWVSSWIGNTIILTPKKMKVPYLRCVNIVGVTCPTGNASRQFSPPLKNIMSPTHQWSCSSRGICQSTSTHDILVIMRAYPVRRSTNGDTLSTNTQRPDLSNENPWTGSPGVSERNGEQPYQRASSPACRRVPIRKVWVLRDSRKYNVAHTCPMSPRTNQWGSRWWDGTPPWGRLPRLRQAYGQRCLPRWPLG